MRNRALFIIFGFWTAAGLALVVAGTLRAFGPTGPDVFAYVSSVTGGAIIGTAALALTETRTRRR